MKPSDATSDRKIPHVSASQITTFKRCQRKWYLEKVAKVPVVKNFAGAQLGAKHHTEIEKYLATGVDVRTGAALAGSEILDAYREYFPLQGAGIEVERELSAPTLSTAKGTPFTGRIDIYLPGHLRVRPGTDAVDKGVPLIIDHKFKSNLALYGSTPAYLENDTQALVYGRWAIEREPSVGFVDFAHHQYQTKKEKIAEEVKVRLTRDDILRKFGALETLVDEDMHTCAHLESAEETAYNQDACSDYGGCEYKKVCPTWKKEGEDTMSFLKELSEKKTVSIMPPEAQQPQKQAEAPVSLPTGANATGTLYIESAPIPAGDLIELDDIVCNCAREIASKYDAVDIRLAEELGFGKYKGVLANEVLKRIDLTKNYHISRSGLSGDILDVIKAVFIKKVAGRK